MRPAEDLSPAVWAHFRRPRHPGRPAGDCRHGRGGALRTGSLIDLWLRVDDGTVREAGFEAFGCPSTIAAASWVCDWLPGRSLAAARGLDGLAIAEALQLAAAKRGVALVAEDALKAALD